LFSDAISILSTDSACDAYDRRKIEGRVLNSPQLLALLVGSSFAAGLNVYATVAALGLLSQAEVITLPAELSLLNNWMVIGVASLMFAIEFVADKIPAFDMLWNALHTFVRVPVAALLAWAATAGLSPESQTASAVLGGGVALAAHAGKTAARAAVTPSPEPFSNIALSLVEDIFAVFLVWLAFEHPYIAATIVVVLLILVVLLIRWVVRALRSLFRGARRQFQHAPDRAA
jgi:hypothetical protein